MMVKDDSLYIVAIVAVVAVVGLVIMATGSTVVAEDSVVDSDDAAIAGQATFFISDAPEFGSGPFQKESYKSADGTNPLGFTHVESSKSGDLEFNTDGVYKSGGDHDASGVTIAASGPVDYIETPSDGAVKLHDRGYGVNDAEILVTYFGEKDIAAMPPGAFATMSLEAFAGLTSDQLSALDQNQLIAIIQKFQTALDEDHVFRR